MEQFRASLNAKTLMNETAPRSVTAVADIISDTLHEEHGVEFKRITRGQNITIYITGEYELSAETFAILASENAASGVAITYDVDAQKIEIAPLVS